MDLRSPGTDVNVVYLSSYLGKGEAFGHRCDSTCQVEHVWANLYCCRSTNVTHICDKNCNQRVMYDSFNSLCCVSGKLLPLTSGEQEAIEGVKRKRTAKGSESSLYKRRRESHCNPSSIYASQYQRTLPVSSPIGCSENYMDTQWFKYVNQNLSPCSDFQELVGWYHMFGWSKQLCYRIITLAEDGISSLVKDLFLMSVFSNLKIHAVVKHFNKFCGKLQQLFLCWSFSYRKHSKAGAGL